MEQPKRVRPRRSFLQKLIRNGGVWVGLSFAIPGGSCLAASLRLLWLDYQYHAHSRMTQGVILEKLRGSSGGGSIGGTTGMGSGSTGAHTIYMLRYQYRTRTGDITEDQDDVNSSYWEKARPGNPITVYYLPKVPGHSRLWSGMRPFLYVILFLVGAPMTFMGLVVEFLIIREIQTKRAKKHAVSGAAPHPAR